MKKLLLSLFLLTLPLLQAESLHLKQLFNKLPESSYLIFKQEDQLTMLHIMERAPSHLFFEEISIPKSSFKKLNLSWEEFLEMGAPMHTSWLQYAWNTSSGKLDEVFDASSRHWLDHEEFNAFLPSILNLKLEKVPPQKRHRSGENLWSPTIHYDGNSYKDLACSEWQANWPQDNSDLSGAYLRCYIPPQDTALPFPYWLAIQAKGLYQIIHIQDSGIFSALPSAPFPKHPPEIIKACYTKPGLLNLTIRKGIKSANLKAFAYRRGQGMQALSAEEVPIDGQLALLRLSINELPDRQLDWTLHIYDQDSPKTFCEFTLNRRIEK